MDKHKDEKVPNYENYDWVIAALQKAQDDDEDNREAAKEAKLFIYKRDGQWEQNVINNSSGKPRYTFDVVGPVIDQIAGDMEKSDFSIRITPSSGDAKKEYAETYDGLCRHIDKISGAQAIYDKAGRGMVVSGLDGWRVVQQYAEGDSFDQDLIIKRISNYINRVWHGPHEEQDASDANYCWILTSMSEEEFKAQYGEEEDAESKSPSNLHCPAGDVIVGEFLYLKDEPRELVKMSDGSVLEVDDAFTATADELAEQGITEVARRERPKKCVYSRLFTLNGWLGDTRETVFENWIPVVPCYANFDIIDDESDETKPIYFGAVEKLIDPQRVFNYSLSREIEEGALAPRAKYWLTEKQAEGHEEELATLNTNSDPVQFYNPDDRVAGQPQQTGGAQINSGLRTISEAMKDIVGVSAGMFAANMGDNPGLQSGVAIGKLQDRGDIGSNKYTLSREIAQRQTARIIVNAIPRVYEPGRQVRLLREDGSQKMATIGQRVLDQEGKRTHVLNDLSVGTYDVDVSSGPSFKTRQNETVEAIVKVGQVDPSVVEMGSDIMLGNIPSPGMDDLAARKRQQLFQAGMIPPDQLNEEEQAQVKAAQQAAQNQPPQPDPAVVLAQAEQTKAQADIADSQTKQQQAQINMQMDMQKLSIQQFEAETKRIEAETKRYLAMADASKKDAETAKAKADADAKEMENVATLAEITAPTPVTATVIDIEPTSGLDDMLTGSALEEV